MRDPSAALAVHVADSLAGLEVESLRQADWIADLGSGAGFPGLVLAAALPGAQVDLVESARRKCAVIDRLGRAAGLHNARSIPRRAEEWAGGAGRAAYGAVTARALASLPVLVEYAAPLLRPGGVLVAWKGARAAEEERAGGVAAAQVGLSPREVVPVRPFARARHRNLHIYEKTGETPEGLPRRPGRALKRPLA